MTEVTEDFSNIDAVIASLGRALSNLVPPPEMLASEWAEANLKIPVGNAIPGPISFDNAPYQRGMINAINEIGIRRIDMMLGAQTGKTTVIQGVTGYFIEHDPRSQIMVQPTQGDVQTYLETKLRPMLDANASISKKMAKQRGREGVNNSRIISYIGGWLMFGWAGSPKTLRGRSAPITLADEVDGMDTTPEGDPVELLSQRAATFGDQAISIRSSTPTIKGSSRIETGFDDGDQRRYFVACPHCGHAQYFRWPQVRWEGRESTNTKDWESDVGKDHLPETAMYLCEAEGCGGLWTDGDRIAAIRGADAAGLGWIASKPFRGHASFHLPEMASTFRRLRDIVQSYLDKISVGDIQVFINVSLAETFEETGEKADPDSLFKRCVEWDVSVPAGGLFLTAGIDMQQDRLEVEVVAWGIGEQSWSVEYRVLWGDPLTQDPWDELTAMLDETWLHESGAQLGIGSSALDTGGTGGMTQAAYDYAKGKTGRRLFAIKGGGTWGSPVVAAPSRKQSGNRARKVDLFIVGTDETKLIVMRRLAQQVPGPGYCHFPAGRDEEYFKQLTAEKLMTRYEKGFPVREWHKTRDRNEALDCRSYAYAALKIANPSMKRLAERLKMPENAPETVEIRSVLEQEPVEKKPVQVIQRVAPTPEKSPENPPQEEKQAKSETKAIKRSKGATKRAGWMNSWR